MASLTALKGSPVFLYLAWLEDLWPRLLSRVPGQPLAPPQYGAALLMAYLGGFSLPELSALAELDFTRLTEWRRSPDFLRLMDWSKARYASWFREHILLTDYAWQQYLEIAGEFACLEDSLQVRLRSALYPQLTSTGERLISQERHRLPLETGVMPPFRRLCQFFWALEAFFPSPARPALARRYVPLAREVVWPALGLGQGEALPAEPWHEASAGAIKQILAKEIRRVFRRPPGKGKE